MMSKHKWPDLSQGVPLHNRDGHLVAYLQVKDPENWHPIVVDGKIVGTIGQRSLPSVERVPRPITELALEFVKNSARQLLNLILR